MYADVDYLLSLLQQPTTSERRCPLCDHDGSSMSEGICVVSVPICSDDFHGMRACGCKCVFPATGTPLGQPFKDVLAEQMKDPEFAAAYEEISAEEDMICAVSDSRQLLCFGMSVKDMEVDTGK